MTDPAPGAGPSPNVQRARKLLLGGLVGGHLAWLACVAAFGVAGGVRGAASAALGGVVALAFFTIGQAVQIRVADADPRRVLFASLVSYAVRIGALGGLLALAMANRERLSGLDPTAVAIGSIAVVVGWLAGEIRIFVRLRIPVFDETGHPPDSR